MSNCLDFVVLGAQKSGTTALFHYLYKHPDIFIPDNKEAPFFSRDDRYEKGIEWYCDEYFTDAKTTDVKGTVSPQYLCAEYIAPRIKESFPDIKLIALLRDPVERAISHYRMLVERDGLNKNALDYFSEITSPSFSEQVREYEVSTVNEEALCLVWGEYARLLKSYYSIFPHENVLVLFYDEFISDPGRVVKDIFQHIGVDCDFVPENLGRRYFESTRDTFVFEKKLFKSLGGYRLWKSLPSKHRYKLRLVVESLSKHLIKPHPKSGIDSDVKKNLISYYKNDVSELEKLIGRTVPWGNFKCR